MCGGKTEHVLGSWVVCIWVKGEAGFAHILSRSRWLGWKELILPVYLIVLVGAYLSEPLALGRSDNHLIPTNEETSESSTCSHSQCLGSDYNSILPAKAETHLLNQPQSGSQFLLHCSARVSKTDMK